jgi:hypothetical protein
MNLSRRTFIGGLFAPAVVSATSIMPVKLFDPGYTKLWYKGKQGLDAGIYYAPYIPLERKSITEKFISLDTTKWQLMKPEVMPMVFDPSIDEMIRKLVNG